MLAALCLSLCASALVLSQPPLYTNQFALRLPPSKAQQLALKHGFVNLGQIGSLKGYYLFEHPRVHKRSLSPHLEHQNNLKNEPQVEWVMQQKVKIRKKRDGFEGAKESAKPSPQTQTFPDPLYREQWYLNGGAEDGMDMNVGPAWAKGYTGKGVVVSILDDGIQTNHPDLVDNYDPLASSDINDNDVDPMPRDNEDNKHGTRCAGEVAAIAYNSYCGVGVAYNASIGGVRMLDGSVNDAVEARALSLNPDHIDIYSASWGPEDDGKTVDGPGPLATRAFLNGITSGRKGKGSIFVWASGNGGRHTDSCNCDGYTNSIFTLSISSATQAGYKPWYLEECSSTIATTYSSGTLGRDKSVASVDMDPKLRPDKICTTEHTGTSASAPLAAGMCALALEANPNLTWRDMQHIVVMSAKSAPLERENGWIRNGAGRKVSHKFGFGLMDGEAMVTLAEQWTTVPPQHTCKTPEVIEEKTIGEPTKSELIVMMNVTGCGGGLNEVRYVEQVQCKVSLSFQPRGNLEIVLTSPQGTPSTLLLQRPRDLVSSNFDDWPFLSVHYWGEDPRGTWTLTVLNAGSRKVDKPGVLHKWQLILFGTDTNPVNLQPRSARILKNYQKLLNEAEINFQENNDSFNWTFNENLSGSSLEVTHDCHKECSPEGCYGPENTQCVKCLNFQLHRKCVEECPESGYYASEGLCMRCHSNCQTCAGPGPDNCLTCPPGLYYVSDLAICIQRCLDTYFEDNQRRRCTPCHENCATCQIGRNVCSSCEDHLVLYNDNCLAQCPPRTFENLHHRCIPCHKSCEACNGTKLSDCIELMNSTDTPCKDGNCTRCPPGLHLQGNTCLPECGIGYYSDRGICKECWVGCSSCFGGRRDECVTCLDGWSLVSAQCRLHCPKNMYQTLTACTNCHHFCATCNGAGAYACTSCARGRYLDEANSMCLSCHITCETCTGTGPQACSSCKSGLQPVKGVCQTPHISNHIDSAQDEKPAGKRGVVSEESGKPGIKEALRRIKTSEYSPLITVTVIAAIASLAILVLLTLLIKTVQVTRSEPKHVGCTRSHTDDGLHHCRVEQTILSPQYLERHKYAIT